MGARQVGKSLRASALRPRWARTARWERRTWAKMNGGAAFVRSLAVGMFGEWAGRVVSPRAGFCASGRLLSARSARSDTGGKWMDHPHLSAAKSACSGTRANGWIIPTFQPQRAPARTRGCKWMDHPHPLSAAKSAYADTGANGWIIPLSPAKIAYADTGSRWMRRMGVGASSPSSGVKESVKEASPSSIAQGRALSAPSSSSSESA